MTNERARANRPAFAEDRTSEQCPYMVAVVNVQLIKIAEEQVYQRNELARELGSPASSHDSGLEEILMILRERSEALAAELERYGILEDNWAAIKAKHDAKVS